MIIVTEVGTRGEGSDCLGSRYVLFNSCISRCGTYSQFFYFVIIFSLCTYVVLFVALYLLQVSSVTSFTEDRG
jgi:hypothetical protein